MKQNSQSKNQFNFFNLILFVLYLTTLIIILFYFYDGYEYYTTGMGDRPHHSDYRNLKPGGLRSHGFGIIGSAMMILLLVYSLRKRFKVFSNTGALSKWLNFHIYLGVMGPLLIILHSSFKLNGLVAVSFWAMIAVALSGVMGRYLYIQIPRTIKGNELSLEELKNRLQEISNQIENNYNLNADQINQIRYIIDNQDGKEKPGIGAFFRMLINSIFKPLQNIRLKMKLKLIIKSTTSDIQPLIKLIRKKTNLEKRIRMWDIIHELFHYWHVFHKPFAIIMYFIMLIHVSISIWLGYTWIF